MTYFIYVLHALHGELLKTRRTLAFWLTLIAPAVVVGLHMVMFYQQRATYQARGFRVTAWIDYGQMTLVLWGLLMLPLFITLETALIANWEHKNAQWKHLFALPIPRGALYTAKQVCGMTLIGISTVVIVALIVLSGWALRLLAPGLGFEAPAPVGEFIRFSGFLFVGAWLIIAIQTWVAQRWPNFAVASGVGIALTVVGALVIQSEWAGLYPTTLPILVANGFSDTIQPLNILEEGVRPVKELLIGSLGGIAVAVLGGWEMTRRDVL